MMDTMQWRILQDETDLLLSCPVSDASILDDTLALLQRWQLHPNTLVAATTCQDLLQHWIKASQLHGFSSSLPFLLTIQAWNRTRQNAHEAAQVLSTWHSLLEGDLALSPTREAHHVVLEAFSKQGMVEECLAILDFMERMVSLGNLTLLPPTVETFAHVIHCLTTTTTTTTSPPDDKRWNLILDMLEKLYKVKQQQLPHHHYFKLHAHVDVICFAIFLEKIKEAITMLKTLDKTTTTTILANIYWQEVPTKPSPLELTNRAYQLVFNKLLQQECTFDMDALLVDLEEKQQQQLPMPKHYEMTIQAWNRKCKTDDDDDKTRILQIANHCHDLLQRMEARHLNNNNNNNVMIDLKAYELVLGIYARALQPNEQLLAHAMNLYENYKHDVVSSSSETTLTKAWNHVLKAYYFQKRHDKVVRLWQRMQTMNIVADQTTITTVLQSFSHVKEGASRAHDLLHNLPNNVQPTSTMYQAVVVAFSRRNAATAAQALVTELEDLYDASGSSSSLKPTVAMYNALIACFARRKNQTAAQQVIFHMMKRAANNTNKDCPLPDQVSFATILDGLSRQRSRTAARKAQDLLATMEAASQDLQPNRSSYTSVMSAIVRSGDHNAPEQVLQIYEQMLAVRDDDGNALYPPDVVTYGLLLDMWAKSKRHDAGDRAEQLLREMQSNDDSIHVNTTNYNNVILAHARTKRATSFEKAEKLLREMQKASTISPNTVTYTNVIMALKRSRVENKAQMAWNLLEEMTSQGDDDSVRPNVITMNTVLTSCAFTRGEYNERAVQLALAAFSEMDKLGITPNSNSFRLLFETFGRQVSDVSERARMAKFALEKCRREGLVDSRVMKTMQKYVPPLYEQLLTLSSVEMASDYSEERRKDSQR